ncbi:PadR family transcriptional regulator [Conexibacter arvalis]|uniref:DNA-binding PadR family transcriptional regulator n=1 Tax=Conexibacter arvalis TaxID=912552 RepID=A0A840IJ82_9ACTN|nr:PadR family transcriptional regulator [Conexibacter arvalis]MBB4664084.1 DNA-binding PadR family transcriptional regulator [Conexibacter arvalis]
MHRMADYAAQGGGHRHHRHGCHRGGFDIAELWRAMAGGRGPGEGRHGGHGGPGRGLHEFARGGFPFGPGGWGGPGRGGPWGRRGGRARRGDVRTAALLLLAEEPRNGYQIMQELEQRSGGAWRPSPGSVYPALQQLEDEGLIRSGEQDGRKLYELTDAGRQFVADRGDDQPAPWDQMAGEVSDDAVALMQTARETAMALMQVLQTGSEAQRKEAQRILAGTRRDLYRLLADGDDGREDDGEEQA